MGTFLMNDEELSWLDIWVGRLKPTQCDSASFPVKETSGVCDVHPISSTSMLQPLDAPLWPVRPLLILGQLRHQEFFASVVKILQGWWKWPWHDESAPLEIRSLEGAMPGAHLQLSPKSLLPLPTGAVLYVSTLSAPPLRCSADDLSPDIAKKTKEIWHKVDLNVLIRKAFLYKQNAVLCISYFESMPPISY